MILREEGCSATSCHWSVQGDSFFNCQLEVRLSAGKNSRCHKDYLSVSPRNGVPVPLNISRNEVLFPNASRIR